MAGQMLADRNLAGATQVLAGRQARIDNPKLFSKNSREIVQSRRVMNMGNMFAGNPVQRGLVGQAMEDVYARLASEAGLEDPYDTELADQAFQIVTGGAVEYNDSMLQAPETGMTTRQFGTWMRKLSPSNFAGTNSLQTPEEIKQLVNDGDWKLQGVGKGTYHIVDGRGGKLMQENSKLPFSLKYDRNLPQAYAIPSTQQLAQQKSGAKFDIMERGFM